MARIVVCGYMVRFPLIGLLLAYLHYVVGLRRLGHEVVYLEESGWDYSCYSPETGEWQDDPSAGLRVVRELLARYDLDIPALYVRRETGEVIGGDWGDLERVLGGADMLLNLGGVNWLPEMERARRHALVDMDPLFTQVKGFGHDVLDRFTSHFSYGVNIGRPGCSIPTLGIDWQPTVPPVVPDLWRLGPAPDGAPLTTVASWSAYGGVEHEGRVYGQKDREFMKLVDLPLRTRHPLGLAVSGADEATRERLRAGGWLVGDATDVTADLASYQGFIARSRGEFSVAKHAYVATRSGWFSDRTVCYLAAGRPAVLQDTGIGDWLPVGQGVLTFTTPDEALACLERVTSEYQRHAEAAADLAARYFSYETVLPRLVERALDE